MTILVLLCSFLALAACTSNPPSPVEAARSWFDAVAGLDLARVRALTCERDNGAIGEALSSSGGFSRELDLSQLQAQIHVDVSGLVFEQTHVEDGTALVHVTGDLNGQPVDQHVSLVNEGDAWRVCPSIAAGP